MARQTSDLLMIGLLIAVTLMNITSYYAFNFPGVERAVARLFTPDVYRPAPRPSWHGANATRAPPLSSDGPRFGGRLSRVPTPSFATTLEMVWFGATTLLVVLWAWSYGNALLTDPGRVPDALSLSAPLAARRAVKWAAFAKCEVCEAFKPMRAHHCSHCGRCVLRYDHHCRFLAQCCGFYNYKLFLLFLFYSFLLTQLVTFTLTGSMLRWFATTNLVRDVVASATPGSATVPPAVSEATTVIFPRPPATHVPIWVVLCFAQAWLAQWPLLYLLHKHWLLARHNVTTVDEVIQGSITEFENAYDCGVRENLEVVFGDGESNGKPRRFFVVRWFLRLLPLAPYPPQRREAGCTEPQDASETRGDHVGLVAAAAPSGDYGTVATSASVANEVPPLGVVFRRCGSGA